MRITLHCEKMDSRGIHNDRNFKYYRSHIDPEKSKDNLYWKYDTRTTFSQDAFEEGTQARFKSTEMAYYADKFSAHLSDQNSRYNEARQYARVSTMAQFYSHTYRRPQDVILQIGDKFKSASPEQLWDCALDYISKFESQYGKYCKVLDAALHVDEEGAPHVHLRRVWFGKDAHGFDCPSINAAIKKFADDNNIPTGTSVQTINKRILADERKLFTQICQKKIPDLVLETSPLPKRNRVSVKDYKQITEEIGSKYSEKIYMLEHNRAQLDNKIKILEDELNSSKEANSAIKQQIDWAENAICKLFYDEKAIRRKYRDELEKIRRNQVSAKEKNEILRNIYCKEYHNEQVISR